MLQATNSMIEPVLTMFRYRKIKPEFSALYDSATEDTAIITSNEYQRA